MTDLPILFSAPMIRALLAGRKTMTRCILSTRNTFFNGSPWPKEPLWEDCDWSHAWADPGPSPAGNPGPYLKVKWPYGRYQSPPDDETLVARIYPKVGRGDRLWVREAWGAVAQHDDYPVLIRECQIEYRADLAPGCTDYPGRWPVDEARGNHDAPKWRSSIHMPRWSSRLTLIVESVNVERLQDISEADAEAEGVRASNASGPWGREGLIEDFADLWDSIHGNGAWDADPWVAALRFRVIHANIDSLTPAGER